MQAFAHKDDVEVVFRSFELDPQRAKGDTVQVLPMLASKYGMSLEQAKQAEARVAANAADAGLGYLTEGRDARQHLRHPPACCTSPRPAASRTSS